MSTVRKERIRFNEKAIKFIYILSMFLMIHQSLQKNQCNKMLYFIALFFL